MNTTVQSLTDIDRTEPSDVDAQTAQFTPAGSDKNLNISRRTSLSESIVSGSVVILDFALIMLTSAIVYYVCYRLKAWTVNDYPSYFVATVVYALIIVQAFYVRGMYSFQSITEPVSIAPRIVTISAIMFLFLLGFSFALHLTTEFSRTWAFSWFIVATSLVCVARVFVSRLLLSMANNGKLTRNVVLVGGGKQAERLLNHLAENPDPWTRVIGIFDDRLERIGPSVADCPILGNIESLFVFARKHRVDDIIVTLPWYADNRITQIMRRLENLPVHLRLGADMVGFRYPKRSYSALGGVAMLDVMRHPMSGWRKVAKQAFDLIVASLLLLLLSPLFMIIIIAIKLNSRGPIIFRQPRYGYNNQLFTAYKFRTMYHQAGKTDNGEQQAQRSDPRITRVGAFLRRTSLDELPQLLNVIEGSMSLVGPRPHPIALNEKYEAIISQYAGRHRVKPGITGLAQINGYRGETDTEEKMNKRIEYDVNYIENWSLMLDLEILLKTPLTVISGENAY